MTNVLPRARVVLLICRRPKREREVERYRRYDVRVW